jgi:hypothetical protein
MGKSGFKMRLFSPRIFSFEDQLRGNIATTNMKLIVKNIVSSFLILMLSLLLIITLLTPRLLDLLKSAISSQDMFEWMIVLANVLLLEFLIAVPFAWLLQALVDYRNARDLNRLGMMTNGWICQIANLSFMFTINISRSLTQCR